MKISNFILIVMLFLISLYLKSAGSFAITKNKIKEPDVSLPTCTTVGEIKCPKGFKAACPPQHKPVCVFVGTKHRPACLADSADNTFFSYNLGTIRCVKGK